MHLFQLSVVRSPNNLMSLNSLPLGRLECLASETSRALPAPFSLHTVLVLGVAALALTGPTSGAKAVTDEEIVKEKKHQLIILFT